MRCGKYMTTVSLIIPTLNEEEGIGEVLREIPSARISDMGYELEVLVIDGGSGDATRKIAREEGAKVILERGGKAAAVRRGIRESTGEYIFTMDGDGTYPPEAMPDMLRVLGNGHAMVLGSRLKGKISSGAMSSTNLLGNRILTGLANGLYGVRVSDLCTGMRVFKRSALGEREPRGRGFEIEAGLHALLARKGMAEVPITYRNRKGVSKLKTRDGVKIAIRLFKDRF